ncbi:MAG TPA: EsaB/YukD family protein [Chloroflexia bacterium]|nr:EsaB/YukD family protein [Chloroflexia bacterium]
MQRVIVTVKRKDEARVRDVEVPANVEMLRLADLIARAMRWESDPAGQPLYYNIEAHPLGRLLEPDESLGSAGVWDGSWLVLHPVRPQVQVAPPQPEYTAPQALEAAPPTWDSVASTQAPPQAESQVQQQAGATDATNAGEVVDSPLASPFARRSIFGDTPFPGQTEPAEETPQPYAAIPDYQAQTSPATGFSPAPADEPELGSAFSGWRSLGIDLPTGLSSAQEEPQEKRDSGGFVWRQLDD